MNLTKELKKEENVKKKKKKNEGKKGDYKGMTSLHLVFFGKRRKGKYKE